MFDRHSFVIFVVIESITDKLKLDVARARPQSPLNLNSLLESENIQQIIGSCQIIYIVTDVLVDVLEREYWMKVLRASPMNLPENEIAQTEPTFIYKKC